MRAVVVGATGNVGTSVVTALAGDPEVAGVLGVARRRPGWQVPGVTWAAADMVRDDLLMDTSRAQAELGWTPRHSAVAALADFLAGLREGAGMDTPPLAPDTGGPGRWRELATGVGQRAG